MQQWSSYGDEDDNYISYDKLMSERVKEITLELSAKDKMIKNILNEIKDSNPDIFIKYMYKI